MLTLSAASLEYVPVTVTATKQGAEYNPTGDVVQFAFTSPGASLVGAQWFTGSWDSTSPRPDGSFVAQCLVGPGGAAQLAPGEYQVSVKITDSPEVPVKPAFILQIV